MAGGKFSEAQLFGMTIRESATDGSDFTNPAADYRRLFLGEDGQLHVKDSSGTVTDIGAGSGIAPTILDAKGDLISASAADTPVKLTAGANGSLLQTLSSETSGLIWRASPTGGVVTLGSGNYTGMTGTFGDVTGASITITTLARRCKIGVVGAAQFATASDACCFDIDIDGSRLSGATSGFTGFRTASTGHRLNFSFTVMTGVLSAASHTFKLQARRNVGSGTVTVFADTADMVLHMWVEETLLLT